ncbi:H-type lectin domain-containing protein [Sorangium sp. So ce117]|uniref:H-type lectin domain-containing protein n=1 Tax=Sorangium sp. So ce117 TaxID=3133277 RepID=UPI003F5D56ED
MTTAVTPLQMLAGTNHFGKAQPHWNLLGPPSEGIDREFSARVEFEREFNSPPVVHIGIAGLDVEGSDAVRVRVCARHIDRAGFTVLLSTWFGSQVHGVDVNWIALGT